MDRALASAAPRWLLEAVPSYGSLALLVDMEQSTASAIRDEIAKICDTIRPTGQIESGRLHRLPVRYGGEDAPDLGFVARSAGLSEEEVIQIHTSREYLCYMLGFTPGFAYLGNLDDRIAAPRLDTPRLRIAAGSVGIAGNQTGFYGVESPGGWRIIGKLQVVTFDVRKEPPSLVLPGDRVRFASVQ